MLRNFNLTLSALTFGGGIFFCICVIIYKRIKGFSDKTFIIVCLSCNATAVLNLFLALMLGQILFWQFALIVSGFTLSFLGGYLVFHSIPSRLKRGIDFSNGEEWINLSYLLTLIERLERFSLAEGEQDFVDQFKNKIRRMTSYYSYELPTGIEISRFYKICYRIGIV